MKNTAKTILSVILLLALVSLFFLRGKLLPAPIVPVSGTRISEVMIGSNAVNVKVADTPELRAQGLSGTQNLGADEGMLFVFDAPDTYAFWMKDMRYPIDIIWISSFGTQRIVDIKASADPASYPATFKPRAPADYVLEVPAGYAEVHGIHIGDEVSFQ